MQATREQQKHIDRQPFQFASLIPFCGTKRLAKDLACNMGDALLESDRARDRGDSDDTAFESMFWNGILFIGSDELYDMDIDANGLVDFASASAYDKQLDATFYLCRYGNRRFVAVRYEFKEDEYAVSAWWLTREDHLGG